MKTLYELFNESLIDGQYYLLDGEYHSPVLGLNVKSVTDHEGWAQPAVEIVFSNPYENQTLTLNSEVREDRRMTHGMDEPLHQACVDDALELFGLSRESVLKAVDYKNEFLLTQKLLNAFINFNNADDPYPYLDEEETQNFKDILTELEQKGINTDFRFVSKFESYEEGEQYRVVFGDSTQDEYFRVEPQETLTYSQETVLRDFQEQCKGATIEQKEKAIFDNGVYLPKALLNRAQMWLEKEKVRAKEKGVTVTDPYPADGPLKEYHLGSPTYEYAPRFIDNGEVLERIDVFKVHFDSTMCDPNGFVMARLPVTLIYESDLDHEITHFNIETYPEQAVDCENRLIDPDSELYTELYRLSVTHLANYGKRYSNVYANTAQLIFNELPDTREVAYGQTDIGYINDRGEHFEGCLPVIRESKSEDEVLDQCKAVILTQLLNPQTFQERFAEAMRSNDASLKGSYRSEVSRKILNPLAAEEIACTDGQQVYRLKALKIESEGDYLRYCLDCIQDVQFEVCAIDNRQALDLQQSGRGR